MKPPIWIEEYHYPGNHGNDSHCDLKVWPELNLVIASHQNLYGTSPTNAAEKVALKVSKDFKLNIKKLRLIIHLPAGYLTKHCEECSLMKFDMVWKKGRFTIDDNGTKFINIQPQTITDFIGGVVDFKPRHKISYQLF